MTPPKYWKQEAQRLTATNPLLSLFAMGHHHLLLDNTTGCINAYSIAVDSFINDTTQNEPDAIASEIILLQKFQLANPALIHAAKFYLDIAMFIMADSSEKGPYKNYLELHKTRKKPFKTLIVTVA